MLIFSPEDLIPGRADSAPQIDQQPTQAAIPTETGPPEGWSLTFSDDFTTGTQGWPQESIDLDYGSIKWVIDGGRYQWMSQSDAGTSWWAWSDSLAEQTDFHYSAVVRKIGGSDTDTGFGLLYRWVDEDNYYVFIITNDQYCAVQIVVDGEWTELISWQYSDAIRPDEDNRLTVTAEGDNMSFQINGQPVGQISDDTFSEGSIGLYMALYEAGDAVVEFDDIEVFAP